MNGCPQMSTWKRVRRSRPTRKLKAAMLRLRPAISRKRLLEGLALGHRDVVVERRDDQDGGDQRAGETDIVVGQEQVGQDQDQNGDDVRDAGIDGGFPGFLAVPSDLVDRYSEAAMDSAAAMPVIEPVRAISRAFCRANVRPARAPVSSTSASLSPSTMEPV